VLCLPISGSRKQRAVRSIVEPPEVSFKVQ
jgi:hypothetical protein